MQVSVKKSEGLERQITVQIPAQVFDEAFNSRLHSMTQKAKVPGFRPGKVPVNVVRQKFAREITQEVLEDLISTNYRKAIVQESLKPAGYPKIDTQPPQQGKDIEFTATFEVYPELKLADFSKLKINMPVVQIADEDANQVLKDLQSQRAEWVDVTRKSQHGDRVQLDFEGSIDGAPFEGGKAEKASVEIGAKQMIEDFEVQLVGLTAAQSTSIKVKFPDDYQNQALAGKQADFALRVHQVSEKKLPELDEEFIRAFGVEDGQLDTLRQRLREHLEREQAQNIRINVKKQVMRGLSELHPMMVPRILVDAEIEVSIQNTMQKLGIKGDGSKFPREPFEEEAVRRVKLGLILGEIIKENRIVADPQKVREHVEQRAVQYQDPVSVVKHYYANKELMQNIESIVLEDTIVDWIVPQAKQSEKTMKFSELLKENQAK